MRGDELGIVIIIIIIIGFVVFCGGVYEAAFGWGGFAARCGRLGLGPGLGLGGLRGGQRRFKCWAATFGYGF